jgi:hypothetical protein
MLEDKYLNEARDHSNLASVVLWQALGKLGFKKSGQVMTAPTKGTSPKAVLKQTNQLVDAINMVDKTKLKVKAHDGFIDVV